MNISKYTLLIGLILLPVLGYAQKMGGKYIVTTGDTTQIVNSVSGLRSPDAKFLFKKNNAVSDSILADMTSDYSSLEEALMDVNNLISSVEKDQTQLKTGNAGLSYRLSKVNVDHLQKEKQAKAMGDSILREKHQQSIEEMARKYEEFGNKPTYFINGINVQPETINKLISGDIVERNLKIQDTSSGNPNGEIWFTVTEKAAQRLGFEVAKANQKEEEVRIPRKEETRNQKQEETRVPRKEEVKIQKQEKTKTPKRSVRQIKADRETKDNKDTAPAPAFRPAQGSTPARETGLQPNTNTQPQPKVTQPVEKRQPEKAEQVQPETNEPKTDTPASKGRKTYVRARTVNDEEVKVNDPE